MNGLQRITETFQRTRSEKRAALMPYFTLGYPDPEQSVDIVTAIAQSGADLIELGIPFSDPLADGPTIQYSTQIALAQGMTVRRCLEMVAALRQRGVSQPLLLMGYINPLLAYGLDAFLSDAAQAGACGLIIPDLPPEEAGLFNEHPADTEPVGLSAAAACEKHGLALINFLAPTSTPERIAAVARRSYGFLYLVSVTGVTGAREALPPDLSDFIQRVRSASELPLAVGFGIGSPDQARQVGSLADGVIVGSAMIHAVKKYMDEHTASASEASQADCAAAAAQFVNSLRLALQRCSIL